MVDEKVTTKLNEAFKIINQKIEELSEERNRIIEEETKTKEEKIRVVDAINKVFVPYKGDEVIPESAWEEMNSLRATSDRLVEEEKDIVARKEENDRVLKNIKAKKNILNDAIKQYNEVDNNIKGVKLKEEKKPERVEEAPKPIIEEVYKLETPVEDTINNVAAEPTNTPVEDENVVSFTQVDAKPMVKAM